MISENKRDTIEKDINGVWQIGWDFNRFHYIIQLKLKTWAILKVHICIVFPVHAAHYSSSVIVPCPESGWRTWVPRHMNCTWHNARITGIFICSVCLIHILDWFKAESSQGASLSERQLCTHVCTMDHNTELSGMGRVLWESPTIVFPSGGGGHKKLHEQGYIWTQLWSVNHPAKANREEKHLGESNLNS